MLGRLCSDEPRPTSSTKAILHFPGASLTISASWGVGKPSLDTTPIRKITCSLLTPQKNEASFFFAADNTIPVFKINQRRVDASIAGVFFTTFRAVDASSPEWLQGTLTWETTDKDDDPEELVMPAALRFVEA